jgi:hypothetical protein
MWLSADPAMGEYIPQAPINDEAKKHNKELLGMGGVFNYVNLHAYHYAGNNPVKLTDPDGRDVYNMTGEDIVVIDDKGVAYLVHDGEMHEGRIDGVRFSDGTVAKVTDENYLINPKVDIVAYKKDGDYGARFYAHLDKAMNDLGDWYKEHKGGSELPSGIYSRDQVEDKNTKFSAQWRPREEDIRKNDPRVRRIVLDDMLPVYMNASADLDLEKIF